MSSLASSGPYVGETKADAWLFEHSKFLRKHFSPQGPSDLPSKSELIQERASGDAFPGETKMDAALLAHSKLLRKHIKHEENVNGGIKSKSAMLRESLDGDRSHEAETNSTSLEGRTIAEDSIRPAPSRVATRESAISNELDGAGINGSPREGSQHVPAWQAATDNERAYGDEASLRSAAMAGPGLIEHHPTIMESTPVVERPVPHSLMSNSAHARYYDEATGEDPSKHLPHEDSFAR